MIPVKLSVKAIGEKNLRFFMIDKDHHFYNTSNLRKGGCQPLFLGCDVLSGLSISAKNRCRVHARFAKQGLATKLEFSGCRIEGLPKGDEAYFYNVQGLFKVAFEYHPVTVQRHCLEHLMDIWMTASSTPSQSQLDVAYKVSSDNLLLTCNSPATTSQHRDDAALAPNEMDSRLNPVASPKSTLPALEMMASDGTNLSWHGTGAGDSSDGCALLCSESALCEEESESHSVSPVSSWEAQADQSSEAPPQPVLSEYVCKMCRIRTKMTEREKAELESMLHAPQNHIPEKNELSKWKECSRPGQCTQNQMPEQAECFKGKIDSGHGQCSRNQTPEHTEPVLEKKVSEHDLSAHEWHDEMTPAGKDSEALLAEGSSDACFVNPVLPSPRSQLSEPNEPVERGNNSRHTTREIHVEIIQTVGPGGLATEQQADRLCPQCGYFSLQTGLVDRLEGRENIHHADSSQAVSLTPQMSQRMGPGAQGDDLRHEGPLSGHVEMAEDMTGLQQSQSLLVQQPQHIDPVEDRDGAHRVHSEISSQSVVPEFMDFTQEGNEVTGSHMSHLNDPTGSHMSHHTDPAVSHISCLTNPTGSHVSHHTDPACSHMSHHTDSTGFGMSHRTDSTGFSMSHHTDSTSSHIHHLTDPTGSHMSHLTHPTGSHTCHLTDSAGSHVSHFTDPTGSQMPDLTDPTGSHMSHLTDLPSSHLTSPTGSLESHHSSQPLVLVKKRGASHYDVADTGGRNGTMQADEMTADSSSGRAVDAVSCVLNWIEEANNVRELLCSRNATKPPGNSATAVQADIADSLDDGFAGFASGTTQEQECQLDYVLVVLDFLARSVEHAKSSSSLTALTELLLLILCSAENVSDLAPTSAEWPATAPLKFSALTTFGKWLGDEFHRFEPTIAERVTDFKVKHINNISDLPPAAKVLEELFPPCMVVLASAWIGLTDIQTMEAFEMDHSYDQVRAGGSSTLLHHNRNLYPVIQLILELLNNSLVSGMAHVVYCKLRHAS